jgi:uroporphyrinogen III methyltransferase/synthase
MNLKPPAVVVVGDVVRLREKLQWFDNRPLFGKRILVTRARHQASALSQLLSERGAEPVELPAIEVQPVTDTRELDSAIFNLPKYHWMVFTSVNGVELFFQRLHDNNLDSRALGNLKIGAIGPATARSLERFGLIPDYCPDVFTSIALLNGFKKLDIRGKRFLLLRADIADGVLAKGLFERGAEVKEVTVYRTTRPRDAADNARQKLLEGKIDFITFTSSSTVSNLVAAFGGVPTSLDGAKIACIGPKTAETAIKAGLIIDLMATEHTIPGLVSALEDYYRREE